MTNRLSINQWSLKTTGCAEFIAAVARAGIESVGLWRQNIAEIGVPATARLIRDHDLRVSSLCRGGFLTAPTRAGRQAALDDNRRAVDEAHTLGTQVLVLVVGGLAAGQRIAAARARLPQTIAELAEYAAGARIRLALEPMHPMFAADRAVISTLAQALELAELSGSDSVGVLADSYHIWWDPQAPAGIEQAGATGRLLGYQVSDWVLPLRSDPVDSRGIPGDGCIDFAELTSAVARTGYPGDVEVEVFNPDLWALPAGTALRLLRDRFDRLIVPHLTGQRA